ncbi:cardioacceleratory peptide receptor-like protein, partial [Dinothrombium tinctorium]
TEQLTFLSIIFMMIVFGNGSVLITLFMSKNRKSRMNFFIMHLAFADLMVGLINVLTDIIWRITIGFYAGNIACKVVRFSQVLVTYSSTYVLVSLSIDRYDAITHPMNFSRSWRGARFLIAAAWTISFIFSIPAILLNEKTMVKGHPQCWIALEQWQWQIYITLVALSLFFLPAFIIATCYMIIVRTIWSKSRATAFTKSASKYKKSKKLQVFILCWSPYFVWDLLQVYGLIPNTQTTIALSTFIQSLAPLNSAANPFIYCMFSTTVSKNT